MAHTLIFVLPIHSARGFYVEENELLKHKKELSSSVCAGNCRKEKHAYMIINFPQLTVQNLLIS